MIQVVNNHQCGFELAYGFDDVLMYCFVALVACTEVVEAHDTEIVGIDVKIALEVINETTNGVEGVDRINPEDFSRYDLRLGVVVIGIAAVGLPCYMQRVGKGLVAVEDCYCYHLSHCVCPAV